MVLRARSSKETLNLLLPHLDQFGISRIADLTYLDNSTNIHVYAATRPSAKSITTSMGKGCTVEDAKCSAIIESIETHYAEEVLADIKNTSHNKLLEESHLVLNPNDIAGTIISNQYPIDWCFGTLFRSKKNVLIPHCLLSLDSNLIIPRLIGQNSNGIASGNTFEEALTFSFWEIVERMSIYNKKNGFSISKSFISSFIDSSLIVNFYLHENAFKLPVVSCQIQNKNLLENTKVFSGYACRSQMSEAIKAALFEAIQTKIGIISGVRDDIANDCYIFSGRSKILFDSIEPVLDHFAFDGMEKSYEEEFNNLEKLLQSSHYDLAYYSYRANDLNVLKSFLVKNVS
ncbi:MAG: YcaO-like family protein [Gammaproteobacteria bacterium]